METNGSSITTTNKRICDFYNANPHLSFDAVNLMVIDLISQFGQKVNTHIPSISALNTILSQIDSIKKECISEITNIINQTGDHSNLDTKLTNKHDELIRDIRGMLSNFPTLLDSNLDRSIKTLSATVSQDIHRMFKDFDQITFKDFIHNYDMKLTMLIQNIQQPIYSFLCASEERITNNINSIKQSLVSESDAHKSFLHDLEDVITRSSRSTSPTFQDNKILSSVLTKMFPTADIIMQLSINDDELIIKRQRKTNIYVKNHIFDTNVLSDDIGIFIQTVDDNNCNGILLSQQSGISSKKNYHIDVHNNRIIVYVHDVQYNPAKIQIAVDIIDHLSTKITSQKIRGETDFYIPTDVLDTINNEYQLFISQKTAVADVMKEQQKKVLAQIDELKFPALDKILSTKYLAPIPKPGLKCEMCKNYFANNLKALAAHKRGCVRKQGNKLCNTMHETNAM